MIDELPLHMFGEDDEPEAAPSPASHVTPPSDAAAAADPPTAPIVESATAPTPAAPPVRCQMCGQESPSDTELCPDCGTRLRPLGVAAGEVSGDQPRECQWCDAALPEDATVCPSCGSKVSDPNLQLLGLNVPRPSDEVVFAPSVYYSSMLGNPYFRTDIKFEVASTLLRMFLRGL
jgi:RNA polymerase subunit RPABC4/transcription elongation factor Spt4